MSETPQETVHQALAKYQGGLGVVITTLGVVNRSLWAPFHHPQGSLAAATELPMTTPEASTRHPPGSGSPPSRPPLGTPKASARYPQGSDESPQGLRPSTPKASIHCPPAVASRRWGLWLRGADFYTA
jgi:hypothetical protein